MRRFIFRRLGYAVISLFLLSVTIFLLVRVTGDPTVLLVEPGASRADIEALRTELGPGPVAGRAVPGPSCATCCAATSGARSTTARRCSSSISPGCRTR